MFLKFDYFFAIMTGSSTIIKSSYIISYKNAKKENPENEICLSDIRKHKVFEMMLSFAL